MAELTVFGGGSWGTALAASAAAAGHPVRLWCRRSEQARAINALGMNPDYLKDVPLPAGLSAVSDAEEAAASKLWILALPAQSLRRFLASAAPFYTSGTELCNVAKGIEIETGMRISEIVEEVLPARLWQSLMNTPRLRIYTSGDVTGTEVGGAVKNIMAIAAGLASSLGLGDNARAALVCRGLAEIQRFGACLGAHPLTLAGLAGMGDLVLTCYGAQSRNFRLGAALGRGLSLEEAGAEVGQVAEGAFTVKAVVSEAKRLSVEMPISEGVWRLLYCDASPEEELERLLNRIPKPEHPPGAFWGGESCPPEKTDV